MTRRRRRKAATWGTVALDHAQRTTPTLFATPTDAPRPTRRPPCSRSHRPTRRTSATAPATTRRTPCTPTREPLPGRRSTRGQTKSVTLTMRQGDPGLGTPRMPTARSLLVSTRDRRRIDGVLPHLEAPSQAHVSGTVNGKSEVSACPTASGASARTRRRPTTLDAVLPAKPTVAWNAPLASGSDVRSSARHADDDGAYAPQLSPSWRVPRHLDRHRFVHHDDARMHLPAASAATSPASASSSCWWRWPSGRSCSPR